MESEDDSGEEDSEESVQSPSEDEYGNEEEEGEADAGADTPRVAQWIDDEELEGGSSKEESSEDEQENERLRPGSMVSILILFALGLLINNTETPARRWAVPGFYWPVY